MPFEITMRTDSKHSARIKSDPCNTRIILILLQFVRKSRSFAHAFQTIHLPFFSVWNPTRWIGYCIVSLVILQMQIAKGKNSILQESLASIQSKALAGSVHYQGTLAIFHKFGEKGLAVDLTEAEVGEIGRSKAGLHRFVTWRLWNWNGETRNGDASSMMRHICTPT